MNNNRGNASPFRQTFNNGAPSASLISSHNRNIVAQGNTTLQAPKVGLNQIATASSGLRGSPYFTGLTGLNKPNLIKPDPGLITKLLREETDDRYRYLVRHGNVHYVEKETLTLYVELAQIPNVIVVYRKPSERIINAEKLALEQRGLKSVPLLEGEERLKQLNLS